MARWPPPACNWAGKDGMISGLGGPWLCEVRSGRVVSQGVDYHFWQRFFLGFEARPFYSLNVPNDRREEEAFLEVWCDLMKAELKVAREKIAELRREGANERNWLYAESSLEECSASLEIISRLIQKKAIFLKFSRFQSRFWPRSKVAKQVGNG
jgi:hypothetical protein